VLAILQKLNMDQNYEIIILETFKILAKLVELNLYGVGAYRISAVMTIV